MSRPRAVYRPAPVVAYAGMLLGAVGLFLVIRRYGETLTAAAPAVRGVVRSSVAGAISPEDALWHVLLALAAVIIVGRLLGTLLQSTGQPPVVGEVVAGSSSARRSSDAPYPMCQPTFSPRQSRPFSTSSRSSALFCTCFSSVSS